MARSFAKLAQIRHNEPITEDSHYEFLYQLRQALLLALWEQGRLSPMEHRYARQRLQQQRRDRAKRKQQP